MDLDFSSWIKGSPLCRFTQCLPLTASMSAWACNFPLSADEFTISADASVRSRQADVRATGDDSVDLFALLGGETECIDDLHKACSDEVETCGQSKDCSQLTDCFLKLQYPGALAECASALETQPATSVLRDFEMMRDCWVARAHKCVVGDNFACTGKYTAPPVARKETLTVAQRFQYLNPGAELQDEVFTMSACNLGDGCALPLATGQSTPDGWVELTVPLALGTASQNWTGNRLVTGSYVRPSRIERSLPLWFDHVEVTLLMEETLIQAVRKEAERELAEVLAGLGLGPATIEDQAVFLQVLDCLGNPAAGVTISSSPLAPVVYLDGDNHRLAFDQTTTFRDGAASVFDVSPDTDITLSAINDNEVVSTWTGRLAAHEVLYLKMFPERGR